MTQNLYYHLFYRLDQWVYAFSFTSNRDSHFSAYLAICILQGFNLATLFQLYKEAYAPTFKLDSAIGYCSGGILLIINWFLLMKDKKSKRIIKKFNDLAYQNGLYDVICIFYIFFSILLVLM